jgi:hypothetical protein
MSKINLDALLPRQDFVWGSKKLSAEQIGEISINHLMDASVSITSIYAQLRKPDFQRETNEWDKERIFCLIDCFASGKFIPAIILWKNEETGLIYVIDGAHRLSALLAYLNDDYGDKEISQKFYEYNIPPAELALAEKARKYINNKFGAFKDVMDVKNTQYATVRSNLITRPIPLQWLRGDVQAAEDSFFMINQQGVTLSPTEKELCMSRKKANCIATRAIMKGGSGHQYWKDFPADIQSEISLIAGELNTVIFEPPLEEPIKTTERCPMGGSIIDSMPMIFSLVNLFLEPRKKYENDKDGKETLDLLKKVRKTVWRINSSHASSVGLHPAVYFYNTTGKHQQSSFLAWCSLVIDYEEKDYFNSFIPIRKRFEDFLLKYKILPIQIIRKFGSLTRSYKPLKRYFGLVVDLMVNKKTEQEILLELRKEFDYLNPDEKELERTRRKDFSTDVKNAAVILHDLSSQQKCVICQGYIHPIAKSIDHETDKKFGGDGNIENAAVTHYYCNTGYKNWLQHQKSLGK